MAYRLSLLSLSLIPCIFQAQAAVLPRGVQLEHFQLDAFQEPSADVVTDKYVSLQRGADRSSSFDVLSALQRGESLDSALARRSQPLFPRQTAAGSTPLISSGGVEYLIDIQVGGEDVKTIVDTGSSDTWLIQKGFKCTDVNGNSVSESTCNFGQTYNGTITKTPNVNFNISYGDGEFVTGIFGTNDITIAGITVPKQTMALGTSAYWNGDGVSAGLTGLAYPAITSQYKGTNPAADSPSTRISYNPIFTTMYKDNLSAPTFSLAIQRGSSGGYLAFGGLPPVTFTQTFSSAPIQILSAGSSSAVSFYTITPDALSYTGAAKTQSAQYIVDSGTTLIYAPSSVVTKVAALFSPKAAYDSSQGAYFVSCTAKAPAFGVKIGGTTYNVSAADLILQGQSDGSKCLLGIQNGGSGPYILGDTFLQNVVAVFDVGAAEMRFAAHSY